MYLSGLLESVADGESEEAVEGEEAVGEAEFKVAEPVVFAEADAEVAEVHSEIYVFDNIVVGLHLCAYTD